MKQNILVNEIWQEKYRPTTVKDVISPFNTQILNAMKNPMMIQNYIFYSRIGGTGKTSMSKAIVNDLKCDVLNLNASNERSIDTIRTKVKDFMIGQSSNTDCKKCIIMDEGEKLTKDAADALKNMMEEYSSNAFIILTTNNLQKIPGPLQTRFKIFEFVQPNKQNIHEYIQNICEVEKLEYNGLGINKLLDIHYPSIRKMVNHLQDLKNQNIALTPQSVEKDKSLYDFIWKLIIKEDYINAKKEIISRGVDCSVLNHFIFGEIDKLKLVHNIQIVQILANNEYKFSVGADKNIVFIASIVSIIKVLRQ